MEVLFNIYCKSMVLSMGLNNKVTNPISICCILLVTGNQLLDPENHVKIWMDILFLLRKKIYAKQYFVLTGFMKLGPDKFLMFCLGYHATQWWNMFVKQHFCP